MSWLRFINGLTNLFLSYNTGINGLRVLRGILVTQTVLSNGIPIFLAFFNGIPESPAFSNGIPKSSAFLNGILEIGFPNENSDILRKKDSLVRIIALLIIVGKQQQHQQHDYLGDDDCLESTEFLHELIYLRQVPISLVPFSRAGDLCRFYFW